MFDIIYILKKNTFFKLGGILDFTKSAIGDQFFDKTLLLCILDRN